jgi:hypothetical protein
MFAGNAYISGNVMLTTTSSLVQQVKISNDGVRKHNPGALVVSGGGCGWKRYIGGNTSITENTDIAGNVFLTTGGEREPAG